MADRRSRHREPGDRRHKSSRSASRHHVSSPDGRTSGHNSRQTLSLDAAAALDEANTHGVSPRVTEEELERRRRHERRERRKREQRSREGRDEYREVGTESPRASRQRDSRSSQLAPPPPPQYEEGAASDYQNERRERRRQRSSRAYEPAPNYDYPDVERDDEREVRRERQRKTRIAAGSVPDEKVQPECRGLWQQLRGGGTNASTSYDSFDSKEEGGYDEEPQGKGFWTKKKICMSPVNVSSPGFG